MRAVAGAPEELQIMYGLRGERRLTETELDHLPGFENSRPVRIGNAAHDQIQLDVYGSVIGAFDAARRVGLPDMDEAWPLQKATAKNLLELWRKPDSSLWEIRGPARHYVYSKMMCCLAFDRMVASAEDFGLEGDVDHWREARDEMLLAWKAIVALTGSTRTAVNASGASKARMTASDTARISCLTVKPMRQPIAQPGAKT